MGMTDTICKKRIYGKMKRDAFKQTEWKNYCDCDLHSAE